MIDLSEVKAFLGITTTATDTLLASLTTYTIAEIEAVTGRNLSLATYTGEVLNFLHSGIDARPSTPLDLTGDYPMVFLKNYPVQNVVLYNNGSVIATDQYFTNSDSGAVTVFGLVPDLKGQFTASYTAGYSTSTSSTYTTPNDLRYLIVQGVKEAYQESTPATQASGDNIQSKTVGDFSVTYAQAIKTIKEYLSLNGAIINKYKKILI